MVWQTGVDTHMQPGSHVEREFWKLAGSATEHIPVELGELY